MILRLFLICLFSSTAWAQRTDSTLEAGTWRLGGGAAITYAAATGRVIRLTPDFEYFVWENVSFGLAGELTFLETSTSTGVGPLASWAFWNPKPWSVFLSQGFRQFGSQSFEYWVSYSKLGARYFLNPFIAFGPELVYAYRLATRDIPSDSNTGIVFYFSIFL